VLGLPDTAVLLGWGFTAPEHRRRGLHRIALGEAARQLRCEVTGDVYTEVHPENMASIRGIEAAGFRNIGLVDAGIWFSSLVRRNGRWHRWKKRDREES
jgi:RimJ/RimL family protein N-acetyltransferase